MKAIPQPNFTKEQMKMIDRIIKDAAEKEQLKRNIDLDAEILWGIHLALGTGKKNLRKVYDTVIELDKQLDREYQCHEDNGFICKRNLLSIGVDIEAWNNEHRAIKEQRDE